MAAIYEVQDFLNRRGWAERETDDPVALLTELARDLEHVAWALDAVDKKSIDELEKDRDTLCALVTRLFETRRITSDELKFLIEDLVEDHSIGRLPTP